MRTTSELDLMLHVAPGSGGSLRSQLEDQLREAVRSGRLPAATALPSTRALASELGVSRGVVVEAYAQLVAEGYLVARHGAATRVADGASAPPATGHDAAEPAGPRFDFRPGRPDVALFPRAAWSASTRRALAAAPDARLDYGDARGAPELQRALASYLRRVRGVFAEPAAVVVTSGVAQALAVIARALLSAGTVRLAVEDPSSANVREQLRWPGLEVVPVPVDDEGLKVDALERAEVGAVVVTPAHQFPTGVVLSPARRAALLEWASRTGGIVVEDDYDAEYRYDRPPVGALQGLAAQHVVYTGSVSKTLAPALRVGWLVAPKRLAGAIVAEKQADDLATPIVDQLALADFLERGDLDRHLRRTRLVYRARRDALVAALARHIPRGSPAGVAAGLHFTLRLPDLPPEGLLLAAAAERGVALATLAQHRLLPGPPALLLGYGRIHEPAIDAGVRALADALADAAAAQFRAGDRVR